MSGIQVAPDGTGKIIRTATVAGQEQQVVTLAKSDGTLLDAGLPVDGSAVTQPVSALALPLPAGAATEATLAEIGADVDAIETSVAALTKPADQQHVVVDTNPLPVSGTFYPVTQPVSGTFWPATQPVSGTFFQATQPVSSASDTVLGATADVAVTTDVNGTLSAKLRGLVKILGDVWDSVNHRVNVYVQNASLAVTGTFWQATQPVSGAFFQATQPVSGPLTDTQLRATRVPVDGSGVTQPVSGTFFQATQPVSATNLDVLLSTRTKPADQQHVIIDTMTPALALDATVNGLLKPASTLAALTAIINALPVGSNKIGTVDIATAVAVAKGIQGVNALPVQELNDSGRNTTNYFMAAPIITTAAEVMQSLTGYKGGAAVGATVTPAVVTAGKTYRVGRITISYTAATVIGGALIRLRANLTGVGVVGSPLVTSWYVGLDTSFVAGETQTVVIDYPEGLEFAAGTGIAVGVIGGGAIPTVGTITGYVQIAIEGYEY